MVLDGPSDGQRKPAAAAGLSFLPSCCSPIRRSGHPESRSGTVMNRYPRDLVLHAGFIIYG
jgi:hypothetical protein